MGGSNSVTSYGYFLLRLLTDRLYIDIRPLLHQPVGAVIQDGDNSDRPAYGRLRASPDHHSEEAATGPPHIAEQVPQEDRQGEDPSV